MPGIPDTVLDDIRDRVDIVDVIGSYVPLKRRGKDFWGCCPFHKEKTPSFKVDPERQFFYCFGCKTHGNVFKFIEAIENVDFVGSAGILAQRCGVTIPEPEFRGGNGSGKPNSKQANPNRKKQLYDCLEKIASWYHELLSTEQAGIARRYLQERGLSQDVVSQFKIGYSPDSWDAALKWGSRHDFSEEILIGAGLVVAKDDDSGSKRRYDRFRGRLMFPIQDELGRVVGFSARTLNSEDKTAKYINSPETVLFRKNRLLYGLHAARHVFKEKDGALVCEGQLDVIACHRAGLEQAIAAQGTAFTENHALLLKRFADKATLAFDADTAGQKAAVATLELLYKAELNAEVVVLPEGADPDSIFKSGGAEELCKVMSQRQNALDFLLDVAAQSHDMATPVGKTAAVEFLLQIVAAQPNGISRAASCQWIARRLQIQEQAVFEALNRKLKQERRRLNFDKSDSQKVDSEITAVPQFKALEVNDKIEATLLDLALHFEFVAHLLAERIQPDSISNTPVGRALNTVLALSSQGEWQLADKELVKDHQFSENPVVARLLAETDFKLMDPARVEDELQEKARAQLLQAAEDCLQRLELQRIEARLQQLPHLLAEEQDAAKARELQCEFADLIRQKHTIISA